MGSALRNISRYFWNRPPVGEPEPGEAIEIEGDNEAMTDRYNRAALISILSITTIAGTIGGTITFFGQIKTSEIIPMSIAGAAATLMGLTESEILPPADRVCEIFQRIFTRETWGNAAVATLAGFAAIYLTDGSTPPTTVLNECALTGFLISPAVRLMLNVFRFYLEPARLDQ